jgi:hypothetical protein
MSDCPLVEPIDMEVHLTEGRRRSLGIHHGAFPVVSEWILGVAEVEDVGEAEEDRRGS